jgi:hypothetical protein
LTHFYRSWSYNPDMLSPEEIGVYVRAYQQPGAVRGSAISWPVRSCEDRTLSRTPHPVAGKASMMPSPMLSPNSAMTM